VHIALYQGNNTIIFIYHPDRGASGPDIKKATKINPLLELYNYKLIALNGRCDTLLEKKADMHRLETK